MPRRFVPFILVVFLCVATMVATAQLPDASTTSQTTDCSSAASSILPECSGMVANPYVLGQPYGNTQGLNGMATQTQRPSMTGVNGFDQYVPTYVDQAPFGHPPFGANQYNPHAYAGSERRKQPPTEFQRIVAGAVGQTLPIFGANLFSNTAAAYVPLDRTPVTSDYVIGPGDQILIRVWGQVNFNVHATIDRAGDIYIPQVGNIEVAGLQFEQLDGFLKSQIGHVFRNFDLSVNMGQLRSIQIYVVGNAHQPGSYTVSSLSTLVNALFFSGGPSEHGSMRRIELRRDGKVVTTFDLYDLLIHGDKSHDVPLLPGDVIYIPPVGPQVAIAGSVNVPAIYELKGSETVGQAIALAGGLATMASKNDTQLDRTNSQGTRQTIQLTLDAAGMNVPLQTGDILRIPAMVQRFDETVVLRGNVANPGRYSWKPGMRVRDLIPDQASLETRGYWQRRIALGLPAPEYVPSLSDYKATLPGPYSLKSQEGASASASSDNDFSTGAPLAATEGHVQSRQGSATGGNDFSTNAPLVTAEGQVQSRQGSAIRRKETPSSTSRANATMELRYFPPGDRFSQGQFPIENEVLRTAPSIDWSYAVIERTNPHNLRTSLIPFNLGEAVLAHDPAQNIELEPGDVITVFSTADIQVPQAQRVKYVSLQGEIAHAGIYSVEPGETLRDVVQRAGGLTPKAYLYGSEFLRESTQHQQQSRLDEFVNSMERTIQVSAANAKGSIVNPTGAAALGASMQSQRELIATLRKIRATGRIVLDLSPGSRGLNALPNLPLQDGDQFIVPAMPVTVNVLGAVYDQSSFLYRPGGRIRDYLKSSGGATRNADTRHEFVIRADGSVISKQTAGGTIFTGGFGGKFAYPGDTVVVPDNVNKTTLLRGITDWSSVFSQFGLGIAALTVLGL